MAYPFRMNIMRSNYILVGFNMYVSIWALARAQKTPSIRFNTIYPLQTNAREREKKSDGEVIAKQIEWKTARKILINEQRKFLFYLVDDPSRKWTVYETNINVECEEKLLLERDSTFFLFLLVIYIRHSNFRFTLGRRRESSQLLLLLLLLLVLQSQ